MSDLTHFERLGLPRQYDLDLAAMERAYLDHSRELHPDYHRLSSGAEQKASLELTSLLNQAYTTLKHPFKRGEYLLSLEGGPTASEARQMDPGFLEEILELRMQIQTLRSAGPGSPELVRLEERLEERREGLIEDMRRDFGFLARLTPDDAGRSRLLLKIRQTLNAGKYIQGLLEDLRSD